MNKVLKLSFYSFVAIFGVIILWLTVGGTIAESRLDAARAAWETENGTVAAFNERHPRTEKNEAAKQLEVLAAGIGVNIRPRSEGEVIPSDHPLVEEFKKSTQQLNAYLATQVEKTSPTLDPVPADTASYLRKYRKEVVAIENHLTSRALPTWNYDGSVTFETEIPNLLGHMMLGRLMSAHALLALEEKSPAEAWHALHATSRLSESLQPQPVLITQLISTAISKQGTLLARHFPAPVPAWRMARPSRDRRRDVIDALVAEQLVVDAAARSATLLDISRGNQPPRLLQLLTQPFTIACAADLWDVHRAMIGEVEKADVCEIDYKDFGQRHFASIASWNGVGAQLQPNVSAAIRRVRDHEISTEMTHKILEAKTSRLASAGTWPQSMEGIEKCACPKRSWQYSVDPAGTMKLALSHPFEAERGDLTRLPLLYTER